MIKTIQAIKRALRDQYGFKPSGGTEQDPKFASIPEGIYPMKINGKKTNVEIKRGLIHINP